MLSPHAIIAIFSRHSLIRQTFKSTHSSTNDTQPKLLTLKLSRSITKFHHRFHEKDLPRVSHHRARRRIIVVPRLKNHLDACCLEIAKGRRDRRDCLGNSNNREELNDLGGVKAGVWVWRVPRRPSAHQHMVPTSFYVHSVHGAPGGPCSGSFCIYPLLAFFVGARAASPRRNPPPRNAGRVSRFSINGSLPCIRATQGNLFDLDNLLISISAPWKREDSNIVIVALTWRENLKFVIKRKVVVRSLIELASFESEVFEVFALNRVCVSFLRRCFLQVLHLAREFLWNCKNSSWKRWNIVFTVKSVSVVLKFAVQSLLYNLFSPFCWILNH